MATNHPRRDWTKMHEYAFTKHKPNKDMNPDPNLKPPNDKPGWEVHSWRPEPKDHGYNGWLLVLWQRDTREARGPAT